MALYRRQSYDDTWDFEMTPNCGYPSVEFRPNGGSYSRATLCIKRYICEVTGELSIGATPDLP